jgi:cell division protein ZapA (FtsZ GTPase activity inhibitor)
MTTVAEHAEPVQMALFASGERKLRDALQRVDVSNLTPIGALNLLHELSEEAKK